MINWSTNIVLAYFKKTKQFFNLFRNSIIMIGLEWSVHFAHDVRFIMFSAIIKTISITMTYYKGCLELLFQLFFFFFFTLLFWGKILIDAPYYTHSYTHLKWTKIVTISSRGMTYSESCQIYYVTWDFPILFPDRDIPLSPKRDWLNYQKFGAWNTI